ncbi:hypothetical protein HDU88_008311 [Geranomyces variabilis]|nr:hypothetical protein HDU88_008311 [Geranomyces variabilis]
MLRESLLQNLNCNSGILPNTRLCFDNPNSSPCLVRATVSSTDTCASIANRIGIPKSIIEDLNPPVNCSTTNPLPASLCVSTEWTGCTGFYVTKPLDTCGSVAAANGLTLRDLGDLNSARIKCIDATTVLAPLVRICVAESRQAGCGGFSVKQTGDTCASVATANGLTAAQFTALNPSTDCTVSSPVVPSFCVAPDTRAACKSIYVAAPGDTCSSLQAANNMTAVQFWLVNPLLDCNAPIATGSIVCIQSTVRISCDINGANCVPTSGSTPPRSMDFQGVGAAAAQLGLTSVLNAYQGNPSALQLTLSGREWKPKRLKIEPHGARSYPKLV